jgi:hypothetical protein
MTQSLRSMRDVLCRSELGDAEGEYVVGTMGGMDAAEGEWGRSRRCSGSVWMATLSRTSFDAPDPIASNAFILA